jgi:2-haloalkanoic acid dehalogenase type II
MVPQEMPEEPMRLTDFAALSFDCYGTLIDWETGILATLRPWADRHGLGIGDDALLAEFSRIEPGLQAARPATLYPDVLAGTFHALGRHFGRTVSDDEAGAFGQSVKDWPAFPDSADALAYLKRHYKLAILSNVDRASFAHSNRRLGVDFDLVVTAQDVGSYKPTPRNFEVLLERLAALGVPKARVLHTAESLFHDHVPAKRFGLATCWVNRRAGKGSFGATRAPDESVTPDWQVTSLGALADLHRREGGG